MGVENMTEDEGMGLRSIPPLEPLPVFEECKELSYVRLRCHLTYLFYIYVPFKLCNI